MYKFTKHSLAIVMAGLFAGASPAVAQIASPVASAVSDTVAGGAAGDGTSTGLADLSVLELGEPFRSRAAGIELRPPAGGVIIRQATADEVARMLYPERGWDIRVKVTKSSKPVPLTASSPDAPAGLLELTVDQIKGADPAAQILEQGVRKIAANDAAVIVARQHVGGNRELLQEAILERSPTEFYVIQFTAQLDAVPAANADSGPAANAVADDAKEQPARQMFSMMLGTVRLLDLRELTHEQNQRLYRTEELYHELNEQRIRAALVPRQVMRVVRDGRDVGFIIQIEKPATHSDHDGVEVDLRSHVEAEAAKAEKPVTAVPGGQVIDLPRTAAAGAGANQNAAAEGAAAPPGPVGPAMIRVDRISKLFVTFDRRHEDWSVQTRIDRGTVKPVITTELGNSDMEVHEELDRQALADHAVVDQKDPKQPPVRLKQKYTLSVSSYTPAGAGAPLERQLPPYYLPEALAQLLPHLVRLDGPSTYMFYGYVSEEREVMARYIDVIGERQVTLDGKQVRATAVQDRIGIDGSPTTSYIDRDGQWLGSVSPEQKLMVLPSNVATVNALWHGANAESDNVGPTPASP